MAKSNLVKEIHVPNKKKSTCRISFASVKEMQDAAGDLELKESVTFTITGNIISLNMRKEPDWEDGSLELDISNISGITVSKQKDKKELNDMTSEEE